MKTLLFFDDWFLDSTVDIERAWPAAEPVAMPDHALPARSTIVLDQRAGRFVAWSKPLTGAEAYLHTSDDGVHWSATGQRRVTHLYENHPFEMSLFCDHWDRDASRRFKLVGFPHERGIEGGPGLVGCSPDAVAWRWMRNARWFKRANGSDTNNNMFYNPISKRWCVICRRYNTDRRVAMVESPDLIHWSQPQVIIHPDHADTPHMQIYGMAAALYQDEYFVGAIQCYRVPMFDRYAWDPRIKMQGAVDAQLVYSYDGQHWLRSDRSALIGRGRPGGPDGACIYAHAIITHPDPREGIYIYALGTPVDHGGRAVGGINDPVPEYCLLYRLRRDGFVYLRPRGGWGQITTRTLVPRRAGLTLNVQGPEGQARVQVCDAAQKPIPGYTFDDCVAIEGDEVAASVQWKKKRDLSALIGKPIRLQVRLLDARLYAIHLNCGLWYTNTPKPIDGVAG